MDSINWTGLLAYALLIGIGTSVAMLIFSSVAFLARTVVKAIRSKRKTHYLKSWRIIDGYPRNAVNIVDELNSRGEVECTGSIQFQSYAELPDEAIMEDLQNEVRDDPDLYMIIWKKKAITADRIMDVSDIYGRFHNKEDNDGTEDEGADRGDDHDPGTGGDEDRQRDILDPGSDQRDDGRAA